MRLPTHRATTANLQALYPFIVETGLGSEGVYVGRETGSGASFVYDPWHFYQQQYVTNANILLAGVLGRGKSALAKTLAHRLAAFGVRVVRPCRSEGGVGRGLTLARSRALDAGPRDDHPHQPAGPGSATGAPQRCLLDLRGAHSQDRAAPGTGGDRPRPTLYARRAQRPVPGPGPGHPTRCRRRADSRSRCCPTSWRPCMRPTDEMATTIGMPNAAALAEAVPRRDARARRLVVGDLAGLFDGPTTHPLDFDVPIQVVDTSRLSGDDTAVALVMSCASAWMEAAISDPTSGRRLVVYDEAWRMMRVPALVRRMQAHWKLSRSWGIANLAVVHRLSDLGSVGDAGSEAVALARGLLADCSTRIVYAQETDQIPATASSLGLTDVEASLLPGLPVGRGLWKVGRRSFVVDHVLGGDEQSFIDTDSRMR